MRPDTLESADLDQTNRETLASIMTDGLVRMSTVITMVTEVKVVNFQVFLKEGSRVVLGSHHCDMQGVMAMELNQKSVSPKTQKM